MSKNNIITNNLFLNGSSYAIQVDSPCSSNLLLHNTFINNNAGGKQAIDNGNNNIWNDSKYGNYWSDWKTPDTNNDGIVDNPYSIPGTANAKDHYPMTDPIGAPHITSKDNKTAIEDVSYAQKYSALDLNTTAAKLNWSLHSNARWLNISKDGNLSGVPNNSDVGPYWVNVTVSDGAFSDSSNSR